jgi:hypothetical protein
MARQATTRDEDEIRLTTHERDAVRAVVEDWIHEELVLPPYPPSLVSAMAKLGVEPELQTPERSAQPAVAAEAQAPERPEPGLRANLG